MKARRSITRSRKRSRQNRALLVVEMTIDELHEIEAHARVAGLDLPTYCAAVLLAGDRTCEHGVSILARGAGACVRCWVERKEVARRAVELAPTSADVRVRPEPERAPSSPPTAAPEEWESFNADSLAKLRTLNEALSKSGPR